MKQAIQLACDAKILAQWLNHDILALTGPPLKERQELFDFIVEELRIREALCPHRIRPVRTALENQRDDLLAFALVLDEKLALDCPTLWDSSLSGACRLSTAKKKALFLRLLATLEPPAPPTQGKVPSSACSSDRGNETHSTGQFSSGES